MPQSFEVKSTQLDVLSLQPRADWSVVCDELVQTFGPRGVSPNFFDGDGVVLDAPTSWSETLTPQAGQALQNALSACGLRWLAWYDPPADRQGWAKQAGLVCADRPARGVGSQPAPSVSQPQPPGMSPSLVVDKPLRSGQKVYARGCDLILLAMVNPGAEVLADGHIHVYAPLRGKAMAGVNGNAQARIFTVHLDAELVSVAGVYRTSETPWPDAVRAKPAVVQLSDDGQERLLIQPLMA